MSIKLLLFAITLFLSVAFSAPISIFLHESKYKIKPRIKLLKFIQATALKSFCAEETSPAFNELAQQTTYELYANALSLETKFGLTTAKDVSVYFRDCSNEQIDNYFGYLADHLFTDATTEEAMGWLDYKITLEHCDKLKLLLSHVKSKFQLVSSLSSHQLRKLANELRAEAPDTIALMKKCSLWLETWELKRRYTEDTSELIKQIQSFRKLAQGEIEIPNETLDTFKPSELEQLAEAMLEYEQKKQIFKDFANNRLTNS